MENLLALPLGTPQVVFTALVLVGMTLLLIVGRLRPELVVLGALVALLVAGVVSPDVAFKGFAHPVTITVGFLYIIAAAIRSLAVGGEVMAAWLGKRPKAATQPLVRLLLPVSILSAFTNNTTVVAVLIPLLQRWSRRVGISTSKFLLPMSYATILGGICTLLGTNTNLLVSGLLEESTGKGLSFFDFTFYGLPAAVAGVLYLLFVAPRILPNRSKINEVGRSTREFVVEVKVGEDFSEAGKSVEAAGLRNLGSAFLFQIERDGQIIAPIDPRERIYIRDRLFFTGLPSALIDLQRIKGLQSAEDITFDIKNYDSSKHGVFEAVLSSSSPLVGKSVRESRFREHYAAVILAIHRNGERVNKKVGDIHLQAGDTLLVLADSSFAAKWYDSTEFLLVTAVSEQEPNRPRSKSWMVILIFTGFLALALSGVVPLVTAAALGAIIFLITKAVTVSEARTSVSASVLVIIGASFGIAEAVRGTGLAGIVADSLVNTFLPLGPIWLAIGIYFLTNLYSMFITNAAAAAVMMPVALASASAAKIEPFQFALVVAFAASAEFALPIGYQTNLMVFGPGRYRVIDYIRLGLPLNLLVMLIICALLAYDFG